MDSASQERCCRTKPHEGSSTFFPRGSNRLLRGQRFSWCLFTFPNQGGLGHQRSVQFDGLGGGGGPYQGA